MAVEQPRELTVLDVADRAVEERGKSYGTPTENHTRTAAMWSAYLGVPVSPLDVCHLNALQKLSRLRETPDHRDSLVDLCGYARNAELVSRDLTTKFLASPCRDGADGNRETPLPRR